MEDDLLRSIWQRIEQCWSNTGAYSEYVKLACQSLNSNQQPANAANRDISRWALLPGLCCQASGGDPHWADGIAASWIMFYLAADLMDSVEDQDEPDAWWSASGPSVAINVATGQFFNASRSLFRLYTEDIGDIACEVIEDFHTSFIRMCGGQHQDLTKPEPSLEEYWKIAETKSGTFFSLACRSGARLTKADLNKLENYSSFGNHFGILIQIMDDLDDLHSLSAAVRSKKKTSLFRSLPIVYAIDVNPAPIKTQIKTHLLNIHHDSQASLQAFKLIENSGTVLYIMTEIERHKQKALDCLGRVSPLSPAAETLTELINRLGSSE